MFVHAAPQIPTAIFTPCFAQYKVVWEIEYIFKKYSTIFSWSKCEDLLTVITGFYKTVKCDWSEVCTKRKLNLYIDFVIELVSNKVNSFNAVLCLQITVILSNSNVRSFYRTFFYEKMTYLKHMTERVCLCGKYAAHI